MYSVVHVLQGEKITPPPFWFMRQAGRYLPEYREVRNKAGGFLNLCYTPKLAAEVTLQPIRRFDMDAAIIFSDILVVPHALGQKVWFEEGEGPRLEPLDLSKLSMRNFQTHLQPVYEAVRLTREALTKEKALIGFAGSPWTLAYYMIEGKGSKDFAKARASKDLDRLIDMLVEAIPEYLSQKIQAGADVIQLFDSWAGVLPKEEIGRLVIEPTKKIVAKIKTKHPKTPIIGFPRGIGEMAAEYTKQTGVDGISLGQDVSLEWATKNIEITIQGNLDPLLLLENKEAMLAQVRKICDVMREKKFIFNLGHGIHKETPIEHVDALSRFLKAYA